MRTRGKRGIRMPALFEAALLSPIPHTYRAALADPNWRAAMEAEYSSLLANNTWDLLPRPPRANVVTGKWVFKHKFKADGSLERYKARWVLRGFTQRPGVDFAETFSPVVKPATVRTVLSLALSRSWPIHQLDVNNAFLQGTLSETVYCAQPAGFEDSAHPDFICRLNRSLYGLKQAPHAWYSRFASFLLKLGFVKAKTDSSLFIYHFGADTVYLLLYVDDIVLTASSSALLQRIISALQHEFSLKDLGQLHHFLGMQVQHTASGLFLSQRQYMLDILNRAGMSDCKSCTTPVDLNPKLPADGNPVSDPTDFRSLAGALQYLTFTRPDLSYAVQQVCLHMHDPREPHLAALKRILRYVRGTLHMGLLIQPSSQQELLSTLTPIGPAVPTHADRPLAMLFSSVTASFHGLLSARTQFPAQVPKLNIGQSPMLLLKPLGYGSCCQSFTPPCAKQLLCTATTSAPSTCPRTLFSINAPNMWRLISILFGNGSLLVMFVFSTFQRLLSSLTFSPKDCPLQSSKSSVPAFMSGHQTIRLQGRVRLHISL
jgi:hypothetical protein